MNSAEDKFLSCLAIVVVACLTWSAVGFHAGATVKLPSSPPTDTQLQSLAQAIATAEGYYGPGIYEGHSLPYKINNPGSLKKPALGADSLATWKDTGLIVFPNVEMGWEALRHQLKLMLDGTSTIYDRSDTLLLVASKYADGDLNWGHQVARTLGVSPGATLADIAERIPPAPSTTQSGDSTMQPVLALSACPAEKR